jgi:TolA-binding protein
MKRAIQNSLMVLGTFCLVRCASNSGQTKVLLNPLEERIAALESELKEQNQQVTRLATAIQQMKKASQVSVSETQSSRHDSKPDYSQQSATETSKKVSVVKLAPEGREEPNLISPLMEDTETIADSSQDAMSVYYRGVQLLNSRKFEDAIDSFRQFLKENPHHVYADRAQFMIADSHFKNKDFGMVIVATNLLESQFPYSLKLPEALFERGLAFAEMNQRAQAKLTLGNLMKNFPKDPMAEIARKKWVELSQDHSPRVQ